MAIAETLSAGRDRDGLARDTQAQFDISNTARLIEEVYTAVT